MKFPIFVFGLTFIQLVLGNESLAEDNEALKKIEEQWNIMRNTNIEVGAKLPQTLSKLNYIADRITDDGEGVKERVNFEINNLARQYKEKAELMGSAPNVFSCIEKVKKDSISGYDKDYNIQFDKPLQKLNVDGSGEIYDDTLKWNYEYHYGMVDYINAYENTVNELKTCRDKNRISVLIDRFEKQTNDMVALTRSVLTRINTITAKYVEKMQELINKLRGISKQRIEQSIALFKQCLTLKPNLFFLKNFN